MTKKVYKIEKWIKEKIACWCSESQCEVPELPKQIIEGKILALREMLSFINSLQEEPKPKFKVGDRIKFKGIHNEDVTRVITNIQKGEGGVFRYFFADGSIYSIDDDDEIELVEEPVSGLDNGEIRGLEK